MEENQDLFEHYTFVADPNQSPIRIDKFLMNKIERVTRNKIQNAIKFGMIRVNKQEVKPNFKIKPGHEITVSLTKPPGTEANILAENIPLDIRYEDDDVLVLYKPPGLVVHPGVGNYRGTLVNALAYHFKDQNLEERMYQEHSGLVHRIDKGTSGLMVVGKTEHAVSHLSKQFFDHTVERKYQAIVWGNFDELSGTITGHIGRNPNNRMQMCVFADGESGKHATTHFKVLEDLYYVSLVECVLETGRTHQIRVHMKYTGHTLFNDDRYGGDAVLKGTIFSKYKTFVANTFKLIERPALHAKIIGFEHPTSGEKMRFESDLPDDMQQTLERWRKYVASRKALM